MFKFIQREPIFINFDLNLEKPLQGYLLGTKGGVHLQEVERLVLCVVSSSSSSYILLQFARLCCSNKQLDAGNSILVNHMIFKNKETIWQSIQYIEQNCSLSFNFNRFVHLGCFNQVSALGCKINVEFQWRNHLDCSCLSEAFHKWRFHCSKK